MTTTVTTIQQATVTALEDESDPAVGFVVEAWAMTEFEDRNRCRVPVQATESCSNDTAHGKGCCYGPTGDALCLACQIVWIRQEKLANRTISVDVTA